MMYAVAISNALLSFHTEVKTKSQKDSKSGKKGRGGARTSQKSQKTEGQAQPSANGKSTSLNTSKDTSTTKVEDFLIVSNKDSSGNGKDSSGKDTSAHRNESAANGENSAANAKDSAANAKDSAANTKDSADAKSSSTNSTNTTVQVEVTEESKTGQELAYEIGEGSRQVEQHDSGNARESELKAESVTSAGKELEPTCEDKDEPSTREEEMEVEVSNVVGDSVSAQSEEIEKQPVATTPGRNTTTFARWC